MSTQQYELSFLVSEYLAATTSLLTDKSTLDTIIVDPGLDVAESVVAMINQKALKPQAILLTHGHLDHVADCFELSQEFNIPVVIGSSDEYRLANPIEQLPTAFTASLKPYWEQRGWQKPGLIKQIDSLREDLQPRSEIGLLSNLRFGSIELFASQYPGHTEGSTIYWCFGQIQVESNPQITKSALKVNKLGFTGDVLFAGTIGRTDLPGSSVEDMKKSLAALKHIALSHPDLLIVPGHGGLSTLGQELVNNRFLQMFD